MRLKEKPKVQLPTSLNNSFEKFVKSKGSSSFEVFLNDLRTFTQSLDTDQETYVVENIVNIINDSLPKLAKIFPESRTDDKQLSQSISTPLFGIFKVCYQHEDKCKKCFNHIVKLVSKKIAVYGAALLYFLKVQTKLVSRKNPLANATFKTSLYENFCDHLNKNVEEQIVVDLEQLEVERTSIYLWILPDVFREFNDMLVNNADVLKLMVSCIDSKNQRDIIYSITQGKLIIFKNDGILDCIRESLNFETIEQIFLWQLVQAHDIPLDALQVSTKSVHFLAMPWKGFISFDQQKQHNE